MTTRVDPELMAGARRFPHLFLGTPLRCCLHCSGQTRVPYPAPMVHEATCRLYRRRPPRFDVPADWLAQVEAL